MAKKDLSGREIWQDYSGFNAKEAEDNFFKVFSMHFQGTNFCVEPKPKEMKKIYVDFKLDPQTIEEIYNPNFEIKTHGISPDYCIRNIKTKKNLYVEVKRQDGWVEGKERSAGRGNAHERSCKFFTPGLQKVLYKYSNINPPELPFWVVFIGDITRDPCRVREISLWYSGVEKNMFFWRDQNKKDPLIQHFELHLKHLLLN